MPLSATERGVCEAIADRRDDLVALASTLIGFDTTAREVGDSPRDEAALQGIPSIGYGPPGFNRDGVSAAHIVDEYVPIDGLVACAQGIAVAAMRFGGA